MYLIIPYCYNRTVQQMGEEVVGPLPCGPTFSMQSGCSLLLTLTFITLRTAISLIYCWVPFSVEVYL